MERDVIVRRISRQKDWDDGVLIVRQRERIPDSSGHHAWSAEAKRLPGDIGKPEGAETKKDDKMELWGFDERGSFNAVCGFLRKLGARW